MFVITRENTVRIVIPLHMNISAGLNIQDKLQQQNSQLGHEHVRLTRVNVEIN